MRPILSAACLLLVATSCSSSDKQQDEAVLLTNDFESLAGWGSDSPSLTREQSHSGVYSIKVDPQQEYSLTYANVLGRLTPTRISKVRLTAWAYLSQENDNPQLTLQLLPSPGENSGSLFNQSIALGEEIKTPREWKKVSKVFTLPAQTSAANEIRIFLWRAGTAAPAYIDDITLSIEP